ncbi:MAG: hypothetical protein NC548_45370 [Lachnospiraceae bacterium]|nr:hypothetical protein [Lachnospiraceae bacterium]MCM1229549.1 hypothetical protein [Ruminococcus flavefaciens]
MDIEKTKQYYSRCTRADACSCDYCQNYIDEIKASYPAVSKYLMTLGVDIEIPFEVLLPLETVNGYMEYYEVQYLIVGNIDGFEETQIDDVAIYSTTSHPAATYKGEYFILAAGPFHIKYRTDKYNFN